LAAIHNRDHVQLTVDCLSIQRANAHV